LVDPTAPVYGELSAEQTKNISAFTHRSYRATQDTHKSGRGAKASFYADDARYNNNAEIISND